MTSRQKLLAFAICIPIAVMGVKCDGASITCPNLKNYSKVQQTRALEQYEEIEASNIAPDLLIMINDYIDLRSAIKKCISRRDK